MGNCLGLSSDEPKPNAINPTYSSGTSAPTSTNRGISESSNSGANRRFSETSSSGATNRRSSESSHSHFSSAVSGSIRSIDERDPNGEILETPNLKIFTFAELKTATKGFKPISVLGEGGFGMVYKGWIDDKPTSTGSKTVVAVKKLNSESVQGFEQWQSEVNFLGSLSHPNLVRLLGYCWEDKELLLVYEYMPKGSLENHLFKRCVEPISWDRRLSIALGAARGLAFLHNLGRQIIYRDFKASNILLDGDYNAKLSDFGLAKFGPSGENSHVTTRIMGTYGYVAPEYVATGHLYVKSDVYGFGVVLLEILTGLRAIDPRRPNGQQNLMQWTRKSLSSKKKLSTIMDPRIRGQYLFKAAVETAQLTEKCLRFDPRTRPSMNEVVDALQQIIAMKDQSKETRKTLSVNSKKSEAGSHRQGPVRKAFKSF